MNKRASGSRTSYELFGCARPLDCVAKWQCFFVPGGIVVVKQNIQLEMDMSALFGDAFMSIGRTAHDANGFARFDGLADF